MLSRFCVAALIVCLLVVSATAQTVRFDTNVGTFDMELNPTGNPNLQAHVENLIAYVESGRYDLTVINRADEGFVMQMGGFQVESLALPDTFSFPDVESFGEVIVDADEDGTADFDLTGLDNTRGTVSLALSGPLNSGTSSFFVNVVDNTGSLNPQGFIPFATVDNLATIDLIMGLSQVNLPNRQGINPDLAGDDVPVLTENRVVYVERAFVLDTSNGATTALAMTSGTGSGSGSVAALQSIAVPEPPALVLAVGALVLIYLMKPSKIG